ncbi:hypothetical protein M8J75_010233 [Diaphorina citri]|nr:hypothetical protein M8J75_010233 [Diaphorina citri]KAI5696246.1 hypothetical protein M8J75_010233 [Diaphorina citri]
MDDRRVADYFVVCGLPDDQAEWEEETSEHSHYKSNHNDAPITDLAVIFPTLGEFVPDGYDVIKSTPTDLNHGSFKSPEVFLCYRRGRDKPPLVDVGIMFDGKEKILPDSEIVSKTPEGRCANVNNSTARTFVTYRRAPPTLPPNTLVVTDICVIIPSKMETPPHAFCVINKNLNRGLVGSDVFLCYKKSMNSARSLVYKPQLLVQYPNMDRADFAFPRSVPIFCLPMGATLEAWPVNVQRPSPIFSTFVLTVSDAAEKVYGSAVTFYEPYPADRVTAEQRHKLRVQCEENSPTGDPPASPNVEYHTNKCLCLLSHWPFFHTFEKFLLFLYKTSLETEPQPVPIERMISHLLEDIPFPSVHRPRILVQLSLTERLILTQPEDLPLPRSGASFRQLLLNLGPDNTLLLLLCALTEQKLLIHSLRPDVLTSVAEAVSMIIFPFKWQCPYIPLCPLSLAEVLHAPLPFLIGVDSRFFDLYEPPPDVNCVDLDTNNITVCEDKRYLTIKLLPKRPARTLRHTLTHLYHKLLMLVRKLHNNNVEDLAVTASRKNRSNSQLLELEIQEAFLRFMASVLKGYRGYLLPIIKAPTVGATDTSSLFDLEGFLRSRDRANHKFFSMISRTQMFIRFIEERSLVSDMDTGLAFFDECTEKVENEEDHKLLDLEDSQRSERTVFIMPPEPAPGSHADGFRLDPALFHYNRDRPPPHHLDLQAAPTGTPGSPMARRTKQEIKVAVKLAAQCASAPELWGKCLLSTCHSIWFIHLPSYIAMSESKVTVLRSAYELLAKAQKYGIHPSDEVCYRVMMQLCGLYSQPVLAVKLLFLMRRCGIQPNAITYGFYNRAVLEAKWSSEVYNSSQLLWNKLRNVILAAALLRRAGQEASMRRLQLSNDDISHSGPDLAHDVSSIDSGQGEMLHQRHLSMSHATPATTAPSIFIDDVPLDDPLLEQPTDNPESAGLIQTATDVIRKPTTTNQNNLVGFQAFDKFRSRVGSIVKPSGMSLFMPTSTQRRQQYYESSAGLLMTDGTISGTEKLLDSERLDSLLDNLPPPNTRMPPRRNRSGSCTEIPYVNNPAAPCNPSNSNVNNSSYHSNHHKRHHHHHSNKPSDHTVGNQGYSKLLRSKSFAHDAQILEKLRDMKSEMSSINTGLAAFRSPPPNLPQSMTSTPSRLGLGGRKASLNRVRESPGDESTESSQENLVTYGTPGSALGSALGSLDELDTSAVINTNAAPGGTPKRLANSSRILSALSSKMERLRSGEGWSAGGRRNSVDSSIGEECSVRRIGEGWSAGGRRNSVDSSIGEECSVRRITSSADSLLTGGAQGASSSPLKHPVSRTLVTENDPLGALEHEVERDESMTLDLPPASLSISREYSGGVTRSQTFTSEDEDSAGNRTQASPSRRPQYMHRSSTMPFNRTEETVESPVRKSSASTVTSGFKLPFSSPAKFNLPNVDTLKINKEYLENALYNFSPSGLTSRKSNEILLGGLNSLKTVATSVAKKYDEIKEAISANNTPVKANGGDRDSGCGDEDPPCVTGLDTPRRKISSEFMPSSVSGHVDYWGSNLKDLLVEGISLSRKGSTTNLQQPLGESTNAALAVPDRFLDKFFARTGNSRDAGSSLIALEVVLVSCSRCHQCSSVLYDEEIMAGWTSEDSNLNTKCQFCDKATVPLLNVSIVDYRSSLPAASATDSQDSIQTRSRNSHPLADSSASLNSALSSEDSSDPIAVPYLNPLVLRKELESILNAEGDECLQRPEFVDQHPIIYWNLVSQHSSSNESIRNAEGDECLQRPAFVDQHPIIYWNLLSQHSSSNESILNAEGDECLQRPEFVDQHPIIYWNLVSQHSSSNESILNAEGDECLQRPASYHLLESGKSDYRMLIHKLYSK